SVQCNQQDMLLTVNFGSPFHGRVYAKGNPTQCYMVGTGQTTLLFAISLGTRCGTLVEFLCLQTLSGRCGIGQPGRSTGVRCVSTTYSCIPPFRLGSFLRLGGVQDKKDIVHQQKG
ncbi:uncharacterized protein NPIL_367231, partial [Nephila pilipes]